MSQVTSQELSFENCVKIFDYHKEKYPTKFFPQDEFFICAVRGHYLDSVGAKGRNDINVFDDLIIGVNKSTKFYFAVRGNVDPSFVVKDGRALARLSLNVIRYYRGDHKGQYFAIRPFPEGVRLPCTRNGVRSDCANTNLHWCKDIADGIGYDTFSEGCMTIGKTLFTKQFQPKCYEQIEGFHGTVDLKAKNQRKLGSKKFDNLGVKHFPVILMEKRIVDDGKQKIFSATGEIMPIY